MSLTQSQPAAAPGAGPVSYDRVSVPLDGSSFPEAAVAPARSLAAVLGAELHLFGVAMEQVEADAMAARMQAVGGPGATWETRIDWDVPSQILAVARERRTLICMASHGRGRLGEALVGSVARHVVTRTIEPVVLVGPDLDPRRRIAEGPVLACVDGGPVSEGILPIAAAWARRLGTGLEIVTVAEPVPSSGPGRHPHRSHGPGEPETYVDGLVRVWQGKGAGVPVTGTVLYDPISAAEGLAAHVAESPASVVAVTTHARAGLARTFLGSQATAIVRTSRVPVLVAPVHDDNH